MKILLRALAIIVLLLVVAMTFARRHNSGWIAFASDRDGDSALYLMTGDGRSVRSIIPDVICDSQPQWSPDGAWLAFSKCAASGGIFRVRANGLGLQGLASSLILPSPGQWSPDSQRLLVTSGGSALHIVNATTNREQLLADFISEGQWSPDGEWIYFRTHHNPGLSLDRIHSETRTVQRIIPRQDGLTDLSWSPDRTQISIGIAAEGDFGLYLLRPDGSDLQKIPVDVPPLLLRAQVWSPDGGWIAFSGGGHWLHHIYRIRRDGSDLEQLTETSGGVENLQWSPDSEWLLFEGDYEDQIDIFRLRADGSRLENLTPGSDTVSLPQYAPVSGSDWHPLPLGVFALGVLAASIIGRKRD